MTNTESQEKLTERLGAFRISSEDYAWLKQKAYAMGCISPTAAIRQIIRHARLEDKK